MRACDRSLRPVMFRACVVLLTAIAGCATHSPQVEPPSDAGSDGSVPVDAAVDSNDAPGSEPPPLPDVAALCGTVPVSLEDWERCYQQRWCGATVGCEPQNRYRSTRECLERSDDVQGGRLDAAQRERAQAVSRGRASIDIAAFTRCLADTSPERCTTVWSSAACATRFTGTIDDGGACFTDIECASPGAVCDTSCTDACCLGTCRPKFREHQHCDLLRSCEPGLVCSGTCLSGDIGTACADHDDCDSNAWCNAGRCRADRALGEPCTTPLQCSGYASCIGLSVVDSEPGRCLSIANAGDRCESFCYGSLYCDASGVCRDLVQLGASCGGAGPCGGVDTECRGGVCVMRDGAGVSCSSSRSCLSGLFCTSELSEPMPRCTAPRALGAPCSAPWHCDSYRCGGTTGRPGVCLPSSDQCAS